MNFNYNLQEAVSEECYNDIMNLVQENLENLDEEQHALATELERIGRKHAPGLVKALGDDVKNTAKNVKHAAGEFLSTSNSGVANALKKIPGVNNFTRGYAASQLRQARSNANAERNNAITKEIAKHQQRQYLANTSPNPAQATARNNAQLHANVNRANQNRANKMAAAQAKYGNV